MHPFYFNIYIMIKILFFDTETTWFVWWVDRIVQFGAILWSYDTEKHEFFSERIINQIINPQKEIPQACIDIHGITNAHAERFGVMDAYMWEILAYIQQADIIVWHNIEYDMKMLLGEISIGKFPSKLEIVKNKKQICTMKSRATKNNTKRQKLQEQYSTIFGETFDNAHDAMADITATKDMFFEMLHMWIIKL